MRYLLTAGVLAFSLAATSLYASAAPAATMTTIHNGHASTVYSPDVAQWTAAEVPDSAQTAHTSRNYGRANVARFAGRLFARSSRIANALTRSALRFLGTPYVFGGTGGYGFDCSGYTQHVFRTLGIVIPRTADAQFYAAHRAIGGARPGDLVFFQTYEPGPSHVGIYLGGGHFVHASSSHGVMVSSLSDSYWSARYLGARRYL